MPPIVGAPRAPYSLEPVAFPFPALAVMAGRAPLGGPREVALACFVVGRLVRDATAGGSRLPADLRRARGAGARHWLGSAAIPAGIRSALSRVVDATLEAETAPLGAALHSVMTVTASQLDPAARLELGRLAQAVAE